MTLTYRRFLQAVLDPKPLTTGEADPREITPKPARQEATS